MPSGIYAPMRKPTAVENTAIRLAIVPSVLMKELMNTVMSVEETVAYSRMPKICAKSTKSRKNSLTHAR